MKWKDRIDVLAAIATIVALVLGFKEYYSAKEDTRISATLPYIARFKADAVFQSVLKIDGAWSSEEAKPYLALQENDAPNWPAMQHEFIVSRGLATDVRIVTDFFDEFYICASHDICDLNLAISVLGQDIRGFCIEQCYHLAQERNGYHPQLGCGLLRLFNAVRESNNGKTSVSISALQLPIKLLDRLDPKRLCPVVDRPAT